MRHVDPENHEACVVCGESLRWVVDRDCITNKVNCKGHALLIISKQEEHCHEDIDNCCGVWLDDNEDAHTCIGMCDQEPTVEVRLIDGGKLDHAKFFHDNFQDKLDPETDFKNWDDH